MDLKLTADGDLDITNGRLSWVTGVNATVQRVTMRLRSLLGESVYNRLGGTPWRQVLFQRGITEAQATAILAQHIRSTRGVDDVVDLVVAIDRTDRTMNVRGVVTASGDSVPINITVNP